MNWELQQSDGLRFYLGQELRSGLPPEEPGLKGGDRIVGFNGAALATVKTARDAKRLCQLEGGKPFSPTGGVGMSRCRPLLSANEDQDCDHC